MEFSLNERQLYYRDLARSLANERLAPRAAEIDETAEYPWDNVRLLAEHGFTAIAIPEAYGGRGEDALTLCIVAEELSRGCASTSAILLAYCLALYPIILAGSEEQKQHYLPRVARGEIGGCFSITEPGAGSDVSVLETTAQRVGDEYVLNGTKIFVGNGGPAQLYVVMASSDKSLRAKGISGFIVEKDTPGFRIGRIERKMGIRGTSTAELIFEDCHISRSSLLGEEGQGFKIAMQTLDAARPTVAAQAIGIAQAAFEAATSHAKRRVQFGQPLANQQAIQFMLADMATEINAARLLTYQAAWLKDQGSPRFSKEAAMAKLFASEMSHRVVHKALQIHGGFGYTKDCPVERYYRDQRITEIYEGTSEIQRLVIGRMVLREMS
jgi:butyryl-CoA dehydrogenase